LPEVCGTPPTSVLARHRYRRPPKTQHR
jgi:hypothetical protein